VRTAYGAPNVARIADVEKPTPARDELLVKVHTTTANRPACGLRAGKPFTVRFFAGLGRPQAAMLGSDRHIETGQTDR
jgi:NADPH:quinone reductase-like Zn-dependent oxidoreductase